MIDIDRVSYWRLFAGKLLHQNVGGWPVADREGSLYRVKMGGGGCFSPYGPCMIAAIWDITTRPVSWPAAQQSGRVSLSWLAIYGKAVLVTLGRSCDEQAALSEHMDEELQWAHSQSCHSCFRTEIKAADFLSSDVYSRIRRKLLVIQTPASYFDGIAVPVKGIGPLFLHLKAVSLGMQRLFHFLENHSFFCWRITTIACSYFILRWNAAETEGS